MKITCESCSAEYDLDESRIPPSGVQMKCPACLHQFLVKRPVAGAPARREIELSRMDDELDHTPLPPDAPGMKAPPTQPSLALGDVGEVDLPAPKKASSPSQPLPARPDEIDLPAPKRPSSSSLPRVTPPAMAKQPAPPTLKDAASPTLKQPSMPTLKQPSMPTLKQPSMPAPPTGKLPPMPSARPSSPRVAPPPPTIKTPPLRAPIDNEPTGDESQLRIQRPSTAPLAAGEDLVDLPAPVTERRPPVTSSRDEIDLPAPVTERRLPARPDQIPDLPAPRRAVPAVDLDAPEPDDVPLTTRPTASPPPTFEMPAAGDDAMPSVEFAPKGPSLELAPKRPSHSPSEEPDLPAPKPETMEVAPVAPRAQPAPAASPSPSSEPWLDEPTPVGTVPGEPAQKAKPKAAEADDEEEAPKRRRGMGALIAVAAVLLVVGGVGMGLGLFTSHGWFGMNLLSGKRAQNEARLQAARKLMLDDTLEGYKKAALDLRRLSDEDPRLVEAQALEAQARLCQARLGNVAEARAAEALLGKLPTEAKELTPEIARARALRSVLAGPVSQARSELNAILASAPSDATALTYLGWTELAGGDAAAAATAFGKAVQAEPGRAAALYGQGLADEQLGKPVEAADLYARTLLGSANHLGAAVGAARLQAAKLGANAAQKQIEELIARRASTAAPRELADAWASVGALAAQAGRRDEAEDRLKKALQLDPDSVRARIVLGQVQCDGGKAMLAIAPLQKLVAAQPKNLDARLAAVRAMIEGGQPHDAVALLGPATAQAPKDPRVLYFGGRTLLADKNDREGALKAFKEAIAADPRHLDAYLAESNALSLLGKSDEALAALKMAETQASGDPQLMLELGQAYLTIHRAQDAEARFRAALEGHADFIPARMALGAALEAQDKLDDAAREYDGVALKQADYPGLLERQAALAARQGRRDLAWTLYQKALGQGVPTAFLKLQAATLALDLDKLDDARKLAGEVVRDDDRSAVGHLLLARAFLAKASPEEALSEARRSATLADLPEAHLAVGRALELLGRLDQSVQEYNLARRPPVEGEASIGRARIMVRMGATRDALAELNTLAKDPKLRAQALLLQGDCLADLSQKDKARHAYEDAVKAAPDSGEAAFKLGRAYLDVGKRGQAVGMLEKGLKLGGDKAPFAVEAWLLVGDAHRESKERDAAVRAYKKYLELAPPDASARTEVTRQLSLLQGGNE